MKANIIIVNGSFYLKGTKIVPGTLKIAIHDEDWVFKDDMQGNIIFINGCWFIPEPKGIINYNTGIFSLPCYKSNRYDILKNKIILQWFNEKIEVVRVEYAERFDFVWTGRPESEISQGINKARPFYRVWLDDNDYFVYSLGSPDIPVGSTLQLNGLLPWDLICYNTDFHNEFLLCGTITDINNLITRWCFKKNIQYEDQNSGITGVQGLSFVPSGVFTQRQVINDLNEQTRRIRNGNSAYIHTTANTGIPISFTAGVSGV